MARPYDSDLDAIVLAGLRSPGTVTLSGHDRAKNWDIKAAKGRTGASTTLNGDPPGEFEALFYLADDDPEEDSVLSDFAQWEVFQQLLETMVNGPTPIALPIYHPDLARNHFTEVTVKQIGGMVHDGKGGATVRVKFLEYRPAKKRKASGANAKPSTANPSTPNAPPDPNAAAKAELAALVAEARKP